MLGAFHIEMAFFKALGKLISESGGADMLTDTGVLAPGSLNGFLENTSTDARDCTLYLPLPLKVYILNLF